MEASKAITIIEAVIAETADAIISKESMHEALWMGISALEKQERDKWVPCSKRKPDIDSEVFITDSFGEIGHAYYVNLGDRVCFVTAEEYIILEDVKAWKPVPEPYREGKNEQHEST